VLRGQTTRRKSSLANANAAGKCAAASYVVDPESQRCAWGPAAAFRGLATLGLSNAAADLVRAWSQSNFGFARMHAM
jgi:hypothetical protein